MRGKGYDLINDNDHDDHDHHLEARWSQWQWWSVGWRQGRWWLTKRLLSLLSTALCNPSLDNLQIPNLKSSLIIISHIVMRRIMISLLIQKYLAPEVLGLSGSRLLAGSPLAGLWVGLSTGQTQTGTEIQRRNCVSVVGWESWARLKADKLYFDALFWHPAFYSHLDLRLPFSTNLISLNFR